MTDIITVTNGEDLGVLDTQVERAKNILQTQIESLTYMPTMGVDLKFFFGESFNFQNESFKAYLIQVLANFGINVSSVDETINNLYADYDFNLSETQSTAGFIGG